MLAIVLAAVLVLTIVAFQVTQGLFSAMITAVLAVLCAAFALNVYPALGEAFFYDGRFAQYADAVSLLALFVLPLLAVRLGLDLLVRRNIDAGVWGDRIGGGAFGLLAAMVLVGVVLIVMQMLPFGASVLGYRPYDDALRRDARALPFCPDDATLGLARLLSGGMFRTEGGLADRTDDLLRDRFCIRNTAGRHGTTFARPDSLTVTGAYAPTSDKADWLARVPADPLADDPLASRVLIVRARVNENAAGEDGWLRLAGTHFRLVCRPPKPPADPDAPLPAKPAPPQPDPHADPVSHYPVGYLADTNGGGKKLVAADVEDEAAQIARLIVEAKPTGKARKAATVYWVYRIGREAVAEELIFRGLSRDDVPRPENALP